MEILLIAFLVLCLGVSLGDIVKITKKYEHIISDYRIDLNMSREESKVWRKAHSDSEDYIQKLKEEIYGLKSTPTKGSIDPTPEDVFENKFKKLVEDSDPRAKERLEQMSKCIFYSSELEDKKVNTRGN